MVRDEADVIKGTIEHLAQEVDGILVADNGSRDGTREILNSLRLDIPLVVELDSDPAYRQSEKMTRLASHAATFGATWIVPFDADEIWFCRQDRIRDALVDTVEGNVVHAKLFNHFASAIDPASDDPFVGMVWRQRQAAGLPKVAFRWHPDAVIHQGNHGVTIPNPIPCDAPLEVRHFPYRSPEQMVRKARNGAAAYKAADLPADMGAHWRSYGDIIDRYAEEALHDVFREHFWHFSPIDGGMVLDPAPYRRWE